MKTNAQRFGRLSQITAFGLIPLAAISLWLGDAAEARAYAVSAGPGVATMTYMLPELEAWDTDLVDPQSEQFDQGYRVRVWGSLGTAHAIAVLVPGKGHSPAEFDLDATSPNQPVPMTLPQRARALIQEADDPNLVVIAWLGYQPPASWSEALAADQIRTGAANLVALTTFLNEVNPRAEITWICHSYGSLVCASALQHQGQASTGDQDPKAVILVGSPGVQANSAKDLSATTQVWAGRGSDDPVQFTALLNLLGSGFGPDPTDSHFAAHPVPCEPGTGHSDYFRPGSIQLQTIIEIAKGDTHG